MDSLDFVNNHINLKKRVLHSHICSKLINLSPNDILLEQIEIRGIKLIVYNNSLSLTSVKRQNQAIIIHYIAFGTF